MAENETLAGILQVSPGVKEQVGRRPEDLLQIANAVEFVIREFDKAVLGETSLIAPDPAIARFLEGAYAVTRYIVGEEPTHPMLVHFLEAYKRDKRVLFEGQAMANRATESLINRMETIYG